MICNFAGGHKIVYDMADEIWKYEDNGEIFNLENLRPCTKCNHFPTKQGHDYCLANLPGVLNACCGHDVEEGYIQFENGVTVRGYFKIERDGENFKNNSLENIVDDIEYDKNIELLRQLTCSGAQLIYDLLSEHKFEDYEIDMTIKYKNREFRVCCGGESI